VENKKYALFTVAFMVSVAVLTSVYVFSASIVFLHVIVSYFFVDTVKGLVVLGLGWAFGDKKERQAIINDLAGE